MNAELLAAEGPDPDSVSKREIPHGGNECERCGNDSVFILSDPDWGEAVICLACGTDYGEPEYPDDEHE